MSSITIQLWAHIIILKCWATAKLLHSFKEAISAIFEQLST